jgi:hypothetical protein
VGKYIIKANEYLLSLHEISHVAVIVYTSAVEASTRHKFASTADDAVIEREIVIFTVKFFDVPLDDGHSPASNKSVVCKHHQHVLIPEVLALSIIFE